MLSSVGVDENIVLSLQCLGSCLGYDGLLEDLVQKFWPRVQSEWLDGCLSAFTVDVYLEWTSLTKYRDRCFFKLVYSIQVSYWRFFPLVYFEALRPCCWKSK